MENKKGKQTDSFSIKANNLHCLRHPAMKVLQTVTNNYFSFTLITRDRTIVATDSQSRLANARRFCSPLNLAFVRLRKYEYKNKVGRKINYEEKKE